MYIYTKPRRLPQPRLSGMGDVQGRYIPARSVDPATGQPVMSEGQPAPWAVVDIKLENVNCRFYEDSPREMVLPETLPHTMEISTVGKSFIGACHASQECPENIHQGAPVRDPWRATRCRQWLENWNQLAPQLIASRRFRKELTEGVLDIANVEGVSRSLVKPAQFLEVLYEQEAREKPIQLFSFVVLAASGGILAFKVVQNAVKKRAAEKRSKKKAKRRKGKGRK